MILRAQQCQLNCEILRIINDTLLNKLLPLSTMKLQTTVIRYVATPTGHWQTRRVSGMGVETARVTPIS